jgi:hypothetical protein
MSTITTKDGTHGEDDQIDPYVAAGPLSAKLLKNGTLKTYNGFPYGPRLRRTRSMPTYSHFSKGNPMILARLMSPENKGGCKTAVIRCVALLP